MDLPTRRPRGPNKDSVSSPSLDEWVFGYKAHIVADANRGIPLQMTVTTASRNDAPLLEPLLNDLAVWCQWFRLVNGITVIADRVYDSQPVATRSSSPGRMRNCYR